MSTGETMSKVLIIDGNEEERARTSATVRGAGHEVDEVPDGVEAFEALLALPFDVVLAEADVGRLGLPALIEKMRGRGVKTPVLVLTSVTSTPALATLLKAGAADCLQKASPDLLLRKLAALAGPAVPEVTAPEPVAPSAPEDGPKPSGSSLLVDTAGSEHERLRRLFPATVQIDSCATVKDALARGRAGSYRLVLFDFDASVLNLGAIIAQMRLLQPEAAVVALAKVPKDGSEKTVARSALELGFDDVLWKSYHPNQIALLLEQYSTGWSDLVTSRDDEVRVSRLRCRGDHRDRYVHELITQLGAALLPVSEACYDHAVLDLTRVSTLLRPTDASGLLTELERSARALGIGLLVAGPEPIVSAMRGIEESLDLQRCRLFTSMAAARASVA
jgi:two-component system chemotaxis response regulator CheY